MTFIFLFKDPERKKGLRGCRGCITIESHDLDKDEDKRNESDDTQYSKYLKMITSLQGNSIEGYEKGDLVKCDLLNECVLDKFPMMKTLSMTIDYSFRDGFAKNFCQELSALCSQDLCKNFGLTGSRDTFTDGFRLTREATKAQSTSPIKLRNQTDMSAIVKLGDDFGKYSSFSSGNTSTSASLASSDELHYAKDNCEADCMALSALQLPLVIFECQSKPREYKKGMVQLTSHGLALRDIKKVSHEIKLVLLTPTTWFLSSLPPYRDCLLYTSPSPRDGLLSRMPSSA